MTQEIVARNGRVSQPSSSSSSRRNSDETRIITPPKFKGQVANRMSPMQYNPNNKNSTLSFIILILKIFASILLLVMILTFAISFIFYVIRGIFGLLRNIYRAYKDYSEIYKLYNCSKPDFDKLPINKQYCEKSKEKYYKILANQQTILQISAQALAESLNGFANHLKLQGFLVVVIFVSVLLFIPKPNQYEKILF